MKYLLTIFISLICFSGISQDRYVSNGGSDLANGLTPATAWATIAKINSVTYSPNNTINLDRGSVWHETLRVPSSGTSGNPITVKAYGTGADPKLEGRSTLTSSTNVAPNIFSYSLTALNGLNVFTVDNNLARKSRFPNFSASNQGYVSIIATGSKNNAGDTNWIVSSVTPPSWMSDTTKVILRKKDYAICFESFVRKSGDSIFYVQSETLSTNPNVGYFFQNSYFALDENYEWYNSPSTIYFYSNTGPSGKTIQVATLDTGIAITNKSYIVIDGIEVTGFNKYGVSSNGATSPIVKNCTASLCGIAGVQLWQSTNAVIDNCVMSDNLAGAAFIRNNGSGGIAGATVTNCTVSNTGNFAGMGQNAVSEPHAGITANAGSNVTVKYNTVKNSGYLGIQWESKNTAKIAYNYIDTFCTVQQDGGGVYTFNVSTNGAHISSIPVWANDTVSNNIIKHGIGNYFGTGTTLLKARGSYQDEGANHIVVDSNTCVANADFALYNNSNFNLSFSGNVCDSNGGTFSIQRFRNMPQVINNIVVDSTQSYPYSTYFFDAAMDSPVVNTIEQRVAGVAINNTSYFLNSIAPFTVGGKNWINAPPPTGYFQNAYNLPSWQTRFLEDVNSYSFANSGETQRLEINYTNAVKFVDLGTDVYRDKYGNLVTGIIEIPPYYSWLGIFVSSSPLPPTPTNRKWFSRRPLKNALP